MSLSFQLNGNLEPGIHPVPWVEIVKSYGFTTHRQELLAGLKKGIEDLKDCGCTNIYLDGSFVTRKWLPNDFDSCWDPRGVDLAKLKVQSPLFFDFKDSRRNQKLYYRGEFFPAIFPAILDPPLTYIEFFQLDKEGNPKGIILIV